MIKKSRLSLRDIALRCSAQGAPISHSYISQLSSGKLPPASEEVTRAICTACSSPSDDLILEGYIEKAPAVVRDYFEVCSKTAMKLTGLLDKLGLKAASFVDRDRMTRLSALNYAVYAGIELSNKKAPDTDGAQEFYNLGTKEVFSYLYSNELYFMPDTSMEPLIPRSALLEIKSFRKFPEQTDSRALEPENRDIILFAYSGEPRYQVRRYQKSGSLILLVPENNQYDIIQVESPNKLYIAGKVVSYKARIK